MTKFQTTLATAAVGLTAGLVGLFFIPEAKASDCIQGDGYEMCFDLTQKNGAYEKWFVTVTNNYTRETMNVVCNDYSKTTVDWESHGGFNQQEAQYLADKFCSL